MARNRPPIVVLSEQEGELLRAHLAGVSAAWERIAETEGLPPGAEPCAHAKSALRLFLFEREKGLTSIDRTLFERAGLPLPDLSVEAGPLAGLGPSELAEHVRRGCRERGSIPTIRATYQTAKKPAEPKADVQTESAPPFNGREGVPVPGYAWEAEIFATHANAIAQAVRDTAEGAKIDPAKMCDHAVCSIRRILLARNPHARAVEKALLARAGITPPDLTDPVVERWMEARTDDGSLKAHVESCPLRHVPANWPVIIVSADGGARPERVPVAHGTAFRWPDPLWS